MGEKANAEEPACSLTDHEFRERRATARESLLAHLVEIKKLESGLRLRFTDTDTIRSTVETFVNLERQCCSFLTLTITPHHEALEVSIEGPAEAKATLEMLAESLSSAR